MKKPSSIHARLCGALAGVLFATLGTLAQAAEPLRIGYAKWSDTELTSKLAAMAIKDKLGIDSKLIQADIGIHFQALSNGSIDLITIVWLPNTHKAFYDKFKDSLEDLGVIYSGRIGWAVPESVPASELKSIEDLNKPEVRKALDGQILASEVGNGQYKLSLKAIEDYKLEGYKVMASSEAGMLNGMDRNISRGKWAVINAWTPHWMNTHWKLRYLDDPKQVFGTDEYVHVIARHGFTADSPQVANFFKHFSIPVPELEQLMTDAKASSVDQAVAAYYSANKPRFAAMFEEGR